MRLMFDRQLDELKNMLIEMGALIEEAIKKTMQSLKNGDIVLAKSVITGDNDIDDKEMDIEKLALKLLLQQHPVASDLRQISAALKMVTDMERIGDQAADIAEITTYGCVLPPTGLDFITQMAEETSLMVTRSIDAFVKKDLALVKKVKVMDDTVDNLFMQVRSEAIRLLSSSQADGEQIIDLLMIAKYFERIGDHAENIAEWVDYSITGIHKSHSSKE
ncbi:MAG: phosphate signaling complex protein PhoU [Lachnospiraceae bacterium]|nr:phosphate signaling complex protein PhoU [Lachnospiraceae bacterium]